MTVSATQCARGLPSFGMWDGAHVTEMGSWIAPGTSWIWEGGRVTDVGNARARIALLTGGRGVGLAGVVLLPDELHVLGRGRWCVLRYGAQRDPHSD